MIKFKEILELWRKDNSLTQAYNDSKTMLENAYEMYIESVRILRRSDTSDGREELRERDVLINKYEREVRSKVLKYLAVTGGANIIPGLILTSIVIDLERIGDYTKNIADLSKIHPDRLLGGIFEEEIVKIEETVENLFKNLIPLLLSSEKERARECINSSFWILKASDKIVERCVLSEDTTLAAGTTTAIALYVRYLKRVGAHLINVATSIVNPFEKIGFMLDE
ncbi:MAG: hypothetical protein H6696_01020 [Deferribacteres bacterium]|nr:hypothetical protein [candidate division KSB1 bacterium]MCB9500489.1 hypothetical protein [Deferribacteres bacterium]